MSVVKYRKLSTGNYLGRSGKYYIFIYKREHGKWDGFDRYVKWYTARIGIGGEWVAWEGTFGSYLKTLGKAKWWVKNWISKQTPGVETPGETHKP